MMFLKIKIKEDLASYLSSEPFSCSTAAVENNIGWKDPLEW